MTESATAEKPQAPPVEQPRADSGQVTLFVPRAQADDAPPVRERKRRGTETMQPAWVQASRVRAHRPFIVSERPTQGLMWLPRSRAGIATVVVTRHAAPSELGVRGAPSRWRLFWERGTLYEIDLGLHHTSLDLELPSAVDMFLFRAHVTVEWRVLDPVRVVQDHIFDIRQALGPALFGLLALDTRRFRVDEVYDAERAVAAALHQHEIGIEYGLAATIRAQLSADPGASEHAASRRALQQKIEIEGLRHDHQWLQEANEEKVIRGRIRLYREIISAGDVEQFALQLARNPEGVESVVKLVREVREEEHRHVTDFLTRLLESGSIDRWEVKDTVQSALDWLKENNDRVVQTGQAQVPWQRGAPRQERNGKTSFVK